MKLHLPISLRRSLLSLVLSAAVSTPAWAGTYTSEIDLQVYADFGQNCGRYSVTNVNALLRDLNADGVYIHYNNGHDSYKLEHGMISFESRQESLGASAAISCNFIATVSHNGVQNPYFSYLELGAGNAIQYLGIEYRTPNYKDNGRGFAFNHSISGTDYKVTRLSKVITDVTPSSLYTTTSLSSGALDGELVYHSGGGYSYTLNPDTGENVGSDRCLTGGIQSIKGFGYDSLNGNLSVNHTVTNWDLDENPLPFGTNQGDSGSPLWAWDPEAGEYRYLGAVASETADLANGVTYGNLKASQEIMNSYNRKISTSSATIVLGATCNTEEVVSDSWSGTPTSTTLWKGTVSDAADDKVQDFIGVRKGVSTWNDMKAIRDLDNWYAQTQDYLNSQLTYADLFVTENLVFEATDCSDYTIEVNEVIDQGIGYTEFTKGNQTAASYTLSGSGYLDSAGYVIGENVEVHLQLLSTGKTREVRKIGDGTLVVNGSGNNDIMLNLGGKGSTILNQKDGYYAAYNVLANNGTTVVLQGGVSQINRDFTFGNGGATLEMAGHDWTEGENFSIHALTQDAVIANTTSGTASTVTFDAGGCFLGSFKDAADASLSVVYAGTGKWTLNSIHTYLQHQDSELTVQSGHVVLVGQNTKHAANDLAATSHKWNKENDWHYSDAAMDVVVNGGTFELGSHARLTGDVTVNSGANYIMREGVQNRYEYIEGGYALEDTYALSAYYGHKGDTVLDGGTLQVQFSENTTANLIYGYSISGSGNMVVDTADGSLTLSGHNTFSGTKTITGGVLIVDSTSSLGDVTVNKWVVQADATLQAGNSLSAADALAGTDSSSTGTLALSTNTAAVLDMSGHENLFVGAAAGKTVEYGSSDDTLNTLKAVGNKWNLGGGGGELVVNAQLDDKESTLVLGNGQGQGGIVKLTNTANNIKDITFNAGVTLTFDDAAALGGAAIDLVYGASLMTSMDSAGLLELVSNSSAGAILMDRAADADVDLSRHGSLALGSLGNTVYSGNITVAANGAYRFGGSSGTLTVNSALAVNGENNLVVDGQGNSGGKVILNAVSAINGELTVKGGGGDMSLGFGVDNAIASVSGVTVDEGGILDVGNTTQKLQNILLKQGGLLRGDAEGTVVLDMNKAGDGSQQFGSIQVGNLVKTGTGQLVLSSADNSWNLFTIKEGIVYTKADNALSATGVTRVENGAILSMNCWDSNRNMQGNVLLANEGRLQSGANKDMWFIDFAGDLSVEQGAVGTLEGRGIWKFTATKLNQNGGTLSIASSDIYFNTKQAQHIGGLVDIGASVVNLHSIEAAGTDNMLKQFDAINVGSAKTLNVIDHTWNTIWQIDKLTGTGTLNWNSTTTHTKTAQLIIGGDGAFSGVINVNRDCYNASNKRPYQAYLQIDSTEAISSATVNLTGTDDNNSYASLALNANRVKIGGLKGNAYTHVFAGKAPVDNVGNQSASTRLSTLVITGGEEYTYSGSIGTSSDSATKGISIEMAGRGTQTLNGSSIILNDVSALHGTLNIQSAGLQIMGDVAVAQGAGLSLNNSFTLNSGSSFSVLGTAGSDSAAVFKSNLVLNGGTLVFDGAALSSMAAGSAALNLANGFSFAADAGVVIDFMNASMLQTGTIYTLANGSWENYLSKLTTSGADCYDVTFSAVDAGLQMTLSVKDGYLVWNGTDGNNFWNTSSFGNSSAATSGKILYFADAAGNRTITPTAKVSAGTMHFANNAGNDYTVADNSTKVSTEHIVQTGTGTTTVESELYVGSSIEVNAGKLVLEYIDVNNGSVSVSNGTLDMRLINGSEKASSLNLENGAELILRNQALTVSNGTTKTISTSLGMAAVGSSAKIIDTKSDYVLHGGEMNVGQEDAGGLVAVKSLSLNSGATLNLVGGNLVSVGNVSFQMGTSYLNITGGALVLGSESKLQTNKDDSASRAVVSVQNGALYTHGVDSSSRVEIHLGDDAELGTSNFNQPVSHYACDVVLEGDATISTGLKYSWKDSSVYTSGTGSVRISGNISSAAEGADLRIGTGKGGIVMMSSKNQISGDVKVSTGDSLALGTNLGFNDGPVQGDGIRISSLDGSSDAVISNGSELGTLASNRCYLYGNTAGTTKVSNARIEVFDGEWLNLKRVTLSDNDASISLLAGAASATVDFEDVVLHISAAGESTELAEGMTLQTFGGDVTYTLEAGARVLEITSGMLSGALTITGESLAMIFNGYDFNSYDAVRLSFGEDVTLDENMRVSGSMVANTRSNEGGFVAWTAMYEGNGGSTSSVVFVRSESVPEPATAALSLLGLAALAARRRRKI